MTKTLGFRNIGYIAATFKIDAASEETLKQNYTNVSTNRIDINGLNLAVKLTGDETVGFGSASPSTNDKLFGTIVAYESDGFVSVQFQGFVEVPTAAPIAINTTTLAVNNVGKVVSVSETEGNNIVINASTAEDLNAMILIK